jgi:hypothetical protein
MTTPIKAHATSTTSVAGRRLVGHAWPTGRPIYTYTPAEIAEGVDVYTRFLKRRHMNLAGGDGDAS